MNTATKWAEVRINDEAIQYRSEHTFGGSIVITATVKDGAIVWDKPGDVPVLIAERAAEVLKV
jgi:hypothetical protein